MKASQWVTFDTVMGDPEWKQPYIGPPEVKAVLKDPAEGGPTSVFADRSNVDADCDDGDDGNSGVELNKARVGAGSILSKAVVAAVALVLNIRRQSGHSGDELQRSELRGVEPKVKGTGYGEIGTFKWSVVKD
ncbi:hypothetical protein HK097_011581 [Rhizophlyctis rosea]|uniref:Uncharacterized protein n=1 Tax=Rhizophlyctis rosea TaxID=64517 RepID=A0AAD5S8K3_9FUNG|nr:hypothetical protein HK097_011581 [Rhizophlyctis rosea]